MIYKEELRKDLKYINEQLYNFSLIINKEKNQIEEENKLWNRKRTLLANLNERK